MNYTTTIEANRSYCTNFNFPLFIVPIYFFISNIPPIGLLFPLIIGYFILIVHLFTHYCQSSTFFCHIATHNCPCYT